MPNWVTFAYLKPALVATLFALTRLWSTITYVAMFRCDYDGERPSHFKLKVGTGKTGDQQWYRAGLFC
jgi:hypothetical protein